MLVCGVVAGVALAGIPGGVLYTASDVRAGFVPSTGVLHGNLVRSALDGPVVRPVITATSVPFGIAAL